MDPCLLIAMQCVKMNLHAADFHAGAGDESAKRRDNVKGAFQVTNLKGLVDKRLLLIDDVMTTGATASACAKVLKQAGASHVTLLAIARVDRRVVAGDRRVLTPSFRESLFSGSLQDAKSGSIA